MEVPYAHAITVINDIHSTHLKDKAVVILYFFLIVNK